MYSQIPTSGAGDFTVTRATTATRVNASGLIESVASGIPRLDYFASGGTVGCPALLVEPAATNLAFNSQTWASGNNWDLTNGVTTATGSTSAFTAPDGTTTANAISPTSANVFHYAGSNSTTQITYTSGTIYTQSAFFKAGTGTAGQFVQLTSWFNVATQNAYANYDLQNGLVTVVSGSAADANRSARIDNYGNGWYRCILTFTANATGAERGVRPVLITASGSTRIPAFAGTVTDVLYGWGAQVETGSVATSYIPTTTASVTRNADVISVSGAVSGAIGQTVGTIYCEFAYFGRPIDRSGPLYLRQSSLRGMSINSDSIGTGIVFGSRNDGGPTFVTLVPGTLQLGTYYKIAIGYDAGNTPAGGQQANGVVAYVNGVQVATGTLRVPDVAISEFRMYSANSGNDTEIPNVRIRAHALYPTRLTDAQLAALTAP
jgi:hypothetical protein